MLKIFKITLLIFTIHFQLWSKDYTINIEKGWQLIGLPTTVTNMRIFNNNNVRLVWSYNSRYKDWEGYSPDGNIYSKLINKGITTLTQVERWQGIWVQSYRDWELTVSDNTELYKSAPNINNIHIYKGWNLLSLPFDTVLSPKIFNGNGYKIWKYSKNQKWQTNQKYDFLDFPEVDELNSKRGFWLYSPEEREIDLSEIGSQFFTAKGVNENYISTFSSIDEVQQYIEQSLLVNNRENKYWNWTIQKDIFSKPEDVVEQFPKIENAITNGNGVNIKFNGVDEPTILKEYNNFLFFRGKDSICNSSVTNPNDSIIVGYTDNVLRDNQDKTLYCFTPKFKLGTSSIDNFMIINNKLIIFSTLIDAKTNPTFSQRCREKKSVISIYDLSFNPVSSLNEKHIFIDGEFKNARVIDNNLYTLTEFQPCIDIDYPKEYLDRLDECYYPEDTVEYKTKCYDVKSDEVGKLFRYNYEFPEVRDIYSLPKYQYGGDTQLRNIISPENFYATPKLNQNTSLFSLSHINIQNGTIHNSVTVFGNMENIYISKSSIYFTSEEGGDYISFQDKRTKSSIYKFDFYPIIEYRALGEVEGKIYSPLWLNEMRSDSGIVRVASKDKLSWGETQGNRVEILKDLGDGQLQRVGRILNIVNEAYSLDGIKFYGDIALASTDSSTQPFQILNLKDIENPRKGDTISIPGKSRYIHFSEDDNRLIVVGRDVNENGIDSGIRVDVFDMSNLDNISYVGEKVLGDSYNFTPVVNHPEALGYRSSDGALVLPIYTDGGYSKYSAETGLHIFNLKSLDSGEVQFEPNKVLSIQTMGKYTTDNKTIFVDRGYKSYALFLMSGKLSFVRIDR